MTQPETRRLVTEDRLTAVQADVAGKADQEEVAAQLDAVRDLTDPVLRPALDAAIAEATTNAKAATAFAPIEAAFGRSQGYWLSRIGNDYTFLLGLGSGRYGAFFLPRRSGTASATTWTINALCGCAIVRPMLSKDAQTDATFGGSGAWTTVSAENGNGTSSSIAVRGRLYSAPRSLTVSTTSGSTTVTVTAGGPLVATDVGRRLTIPGAGAGGAALYTSIGSVNVGAGTFTVGTAPSATLTGVVSTVHPDYRHNSTAGATVTWTSPASTTALGLGTVLTTTGGLAKVGIVNSSAAAVDAANLPTAQELVDLGRYPNTILTANGGTLAPTDRVLDCYENSAGRYGYTRILAADLPADAYTVTLTGTGYQATGGTGSRMAVDRFAYALASTTPTTTGAEPFIERDLSDMVDSAWEYAIECRPHAGGTYTFVGQAIHWYDQQTGLTIAVDGGAGPSDGQTVAAKTVKITRTTSIYHPDSLGTPLATGTVIYRLDRDGFSVEPKIHFNVETDVRLAYLMLPLASRVANAGAKMDRAALSAAGSDFAMTGSGNRLGVSWSAAGWAWDSAGKAGAAIYVPDFYAFTEGLNDAGLDGSQVEDRGVALGLPLTKFYFPWIGSATTDKHRTVPAGWEKTYRARYAVGYFTANAASALARA